MARTFDEDALLAQVDGDIEFLSDTVEMLSTDAPGLVADIRAAVAAGDAAAVGRVAHTLKGMVSNFCAAATESDAMELERAGKAGELSAAAAMIDRLESGLSELVAELNDFVRARL